MKPQAEELYHALIRVRMQEHLCEYCAQPLGGASITWAEDGSTFDDLGLSDESAAVALAATEHLLVRCASGGGRGQIGVSILRLPRPIATERQTPWDPQAVAVYQSLVAARLKRGVCTSCGLSLQKAAVVRTTGGAALSEHGLSDDAVARLLALTQGLVVQCVECGHEGEL